MNKKLVTILISLILILGAALGIARRANAPIFGDNLKQEQITDGSLESYFQASQQINQSSEPDNTNPNAVSGNDLQGPKKSEKIKQNELAPLIIKN